MLSLGGLYDGVCGDVGLLEDSGGGMMVSVVMLEDSGGGVLAAVVQLAAQW